ncbi:metallophosphoesterase family protein [Acidisoma sp.]|uniref:metallophosphoesterase family protein n=1 Tax=Acidisoma sp. TaxID=1872115 RepID=UPI003AFFF931
MAQRPKRHKGHTHKGSTGTGDTNGTAQGVPGSGRPGPEQPGPSFGQPEATPDPTKFVVYHPTDAAAYKQIDELNREHKLAPIPFPAPRGLPEPRLTLAEVLGPNGAAAEQKITSAGQMVFHSVGDTGNTRGPDSQNEVADKMLSDFVEQNASDVPVFFLHLGDVIYNFGEAKYYYDQFYDPYRDYPAPIVALAGNHDGMVEPESTATTLTAFLENFCADGDFHTTAEAGGLNRTAQIQPGVFYTFEAPFVRFFVLYSNTLEDPGVISSEGGTWPDLGDSQLTYLKAALQRAKDENFAGALILAHHHPAYTAGSKHGWSIKLREEVDAICDQVGLWPHAVLSGHAHNYQRFTRAHGQMQIPYIISGNGGHGIAKLVRKGQPPLRTPSVLDSGDGDTVTLESYDDQKYGYMRLVVNAQQLRIEYHPADDGDASKTPDDMVIVDIATRLIVPMSRPGGN